MTPADAARLERMIDEALAVSAVDEAAALASDYVEQSGGGPPGERPERSPWFRSRYLAVQASLAAGRISEAVVHAEELAPVQPALPDGLALRLRLFSAEALARLGRYKGAREGVEAIRKSASPSDKLPPLLRARLLRTMLILGDAEQLGEEIAECVACLVGAGESAAAALVACDEGRAWACAGDLARSRGCLLRAERLAAALADRSPIKADIAVQLGRLDHLRGDWQGSLDRYEQALHSSTSGSPQELEIRLRRSLVYLEIGQMNDARSDCLAAVGRSRTRGHPMPEEIRGLLAVIAQLVQASHGDLDDDLSGAIDDESRGFLLLARGDVEAARVAYAQAFAADSGPHRQARHALALGLTAIAANQWEDAFRWLSLAKRMGRQHGLPQVEWRACQGLGRLAAEWWGDEPAARDWFEQAVVIAEVHDRSLRRPEHRASHRQLRGEVVRHLLSAAARRGDAERLLHYQELSRGRHLLELWHSGRQASAAACTSGVIASELDGLDRRIEALDEQLEGMPLDEPDRLERLRIREELILMRDRLRDRLVADPDRRSSGTLPNLPDLRELDRSLAPGSVYVALTLVDDDHILLVVRRGRGGRVIRVAGAAPTVFEQSGSLQKALKEQLDLYALGLSPDPGQRSALNGCLHALGEDPLGRAIFDALDLDRHPASLLIWAPDAELQGFPVSALRIAGRYLVEYLAVVHTFSGALFAHQAKAHRARWRTWLRRRAVVVGGSSDGSIPFAERESAGVAAALSGATLLQGPAATREAVRALLPKARVAHFACHADIPPERPLRARIELPSGELWYASDWPGEPVRDLPLVTLSACRSAEVARLFGRELFGLVTGVLGGAARAVIAGLWPVADRETVPLMLSFYGHLMDHPPAVALAQAQREALGDGESSPATWAVFALFGDPRSIPPPVPGLRWLARIRKRRYRQWCRGVLADRP
jgi:tetratricopeptide (TPR) repeat protein